MGKLKAQANEIPRHFSRHSTSDGTDKCLIIHAISQPTAEKKKESKSIVTQVYLLNLKRYILSTTYQITFIKEEKHVFMTSILPKVGFDVSTPSSIRITGIQNLDNHV